MTGSILLRVPCSLLLLLPAISVAAQTAPTHIRIVTRAGSHTGILAAYTTDCINLFSSRSGRYCIPVDSVQKAYVAFATHRDYKRAAVLYGLAGGVVGVIWSLVTRSECGDRKGTALVTTCGWASTTTSAIPLAASLGAGIGALITAIRPASPVWIETDPAALTLGRSAEPSMSLGIRLRF